MEICACKLKTFLSSFSDDVNDVLLKCDHNVFYRKSKSKSKDTRFEFEFSWNFQTPGGGIEKKTLSKWAKPIMRVSLLSLVRYENTFDDVCSLVCCREQTTNMRWFNMKKIQRLFGKVSLHWNCESLNILWSQKLWLLRLICWLFNCCSLSS